MEEKVKKYNLDGEKKSQDEKRRNAGNVVSMRRSS